MRKTIITLITLIISVSANSQTHADENEIELRVTDLSEQYFRNILLGEYELAYTSVGSELRHYSTKEQWIKSKKEFKKLAGEIASVNISRVTIYNNPENSPKPGIYVAADYYNEFSEMPIHCGYLVWFKSEFGSEKFQLIREETGHITKLQLVGIPVEQLPALKEGLRCVSP